MNDWYIDRSKNMVSETLESSLNVLYDCAQEQCSANQLIDKFVERGVLSQESKNKNAALTRFRDHGFLSQNNIVSESVIDFIEGRLNLSELIIDLIIKRPAKKEHSPNVKPFCIISKVFDIMFEVIQDFDDIFLTQSECAEYLYSIDDYEEITYELVDKIVSNREFEIGKKYPKNRINLDRNEEINISIWFNALKTTPVFMPSNDDSNILKPNIKQREFFKFISVNSDEMIETPTTNNQVLYDYYGKRETGIIEILPKVILKTINEELDLDIAKKLFEYLFGYKKYSNFRYDKYFKYECFGIFFPFITLPKLVIRHIYLVNKKVGDIMYEFVNGNIGYISSLKYIDFELKTNGLLKYIQSINEINTNNKIVGFNKIYYGIPGCGKSYKVASMLDFKEGFEDEAKKNGIVGKVNSDNIIRTTFYLDYSNSDFVGQIYPVVNDDDKVTYEPIPGPFTKALVRAYSHPQEMVYLVIEEINRGNAAAIFGDLFQLLDRVKKPIGDKVVGESEYPISNEFIEGYLKKIIKGKISIEGDISRLPLLSNHNIIIPNNLTIFATMNTSDQNVFPLDTAFKRRWNLERVEVDWNKENGKYRLPILNKAIPFTDMTWGNFASTINIKMIENSNDGIITQDKNLGPFFVDEEILVEPSERYNEENKDKLVKFVNNVIDYLFLDVTKFNHDVLFEKNIQYSDIYDFILESIHVDNNSYEEAKRYLRIFGNNVIDDIEDDLTKKEELNDGDFE